MYQWARRANINLRIRFHKGKNLGDKLFCIIKLFNWLNQIV